jgi:D-alanyl-D-alanine carboxypeptidase/D-alanyl-D-alanine-endopeptidase (penicillin-binding protein 4)
MRRTSEGRAFERSLAVAGQSGTLASRMRGTRAAGNCRAKTGTLSDVSTLAGTCRSASGHTIAFALLMNAIAPARGRVLQDSIARSLARYGG